MNASRPAEVWPLAGHLRGLIAARGYTSYLSAIRSIAASSGLGVATVHRSVVGSHQPTTRTAGLILASLGATWPDLLSARPSPRGRMHTHAARDCR